MHASRLGLVCHISLAVLWATLLAFLGTGSICAQSDYPPNDRLLAGARDIRFENLTSEDGLSHNGVYSILQDRTGFLWIGTTDGLNRYDGYEFTALRRDPQNPASLSDSLVRALLEDQEGNLWVASRGGLDRIDGATQAISRYQHDPDDPSSLTAGPLASIYEDRSGTLWIGTEQGLNSLIPGAEGFARYEHDPNDPDSISHSTVRAMHEDENGLLWLGTQGGGLNVLDLETRQVVSRYQHDPQDPKSLSDDRVWAMHEDAEGILWLGTQGGLNAFDRETGRFTRYLHDPDDPHSLGNDLVKAIYEDSKGVLWVGAWGGGLNRLDRATGRFTRYQHDPLDSHSLANDKIAAIYEDDGGVLWVGCWGGGLSRFDRAQEQFAHYYHDPDDPNSLSDNIVYSIHEDAAGVLWVGTTSGLHRLGASEGAFTRYQNDPHDPTSINVGESVQAIHSDARGNLWVSGWAEGLNRFDPATESFEHFLHDAEDPSSLSSNVVLSLYTDRDGVLWIGTLNGGLNRFDHQTESFEAFRHDPANPSSLSEDHVHVIYEDAAGDLWLGTGAGGLNRFDRHSGTFRAYRNDPDDPLSLSNNRVNAILQDAVGVLWIGTPTGLNRLVPGGDPDSQDATFDRYADKDGLPSNAIQAILEDDRGQLWLSTNRGLSRFDPQTGEFKNYDVGDGLQGNEFNEGAALRDSQGLMYFGGSNGLSAFHPDQITDNAYLPPIVLTDLSLLNQPVPVGGDSRLQRAIWDTDEITLSYQDQVVTFDFAALSYADPESNLYRYKLEGFEDTWSPPGHQRSATYTNLDPGEYTFRVAGSNDDGVWNEEGASLKITVTPPWWATWWFRGLALVLLAVVGIAAYSWRMRLLRTRQRELEAEVEERRVAERALAGQLAFERLLAELSTTFVNIPPEQIDQGIQESLEALAHHLSHWGPHPRTCSLITYRQDLDRFVVTHHSTEMPGLPLPGSVLDDVVPWFAGFWRRGETLPIQRVSDIPEEASAEREICLKAGIRAVLFAAFSVAGGPAGIVAVNDIEEETVWDEGTVQSIRLVGEMLGNALERQRVIEQIRKRDSRYREQLENQVAERTAELETLLELSGRVASTLELDPLLDLILDGLRKVVDYDGAVIRRLSGDGMDLLAHRLTYQDVTEPAQRLPIAGIPALEGMVEHCTAFYIGDIQDRSGLVDRFTTEGDERMEMLLSRTHSWLGVPLIARDDVIGMLSVVHDQPNHYDQETVSLAQAFANQAAIAIENAQLYEKAQVTATLEERTRLARELHDSATQALYSALLFSETGKKLTAGSDLEGSQYYQGRVSEVIQQALKEMRLLVYELRPPELEAEGLDGALQMRLDAVESRVGMEARLVAAPLPVLPAEVVENLYRIALEALNNVLKHAEADSVTVTLRAEGEGMVLVVADDGVGFDPEAAREGGGLGLVGIQERVQALGGELTIDSAPGKGTRLEVFVRRAQTGPVADVRSAETGPV